jgi:hypothetical protein
VPRQDPEFNELVSRFPTTPSKDVIGAARAMIVVAVGEVWRSCGFTVPKMEYRGERRQLFEYVENRRRYFGDRAVSSYADVNNGRSLDGFAGLDPVNEVSEEDRRLHSHVGRAL